VSGPFYSWRRMGTGLEAGGKIFIAVGARGEAQTAAADASRWKGAAIAPSGASVGASSRS